MARYHISGNVHGVDRNKVVVPAGISVQVLNPGSNTGVAFSTWNAASAGSNQGSSLTITGNQFDFWVDAPQRFDLLITATSHNTIRLAKDVGPHAGGSSFQGGRDQPIVINLTTNGGSPPEYGTDD